MNRKTKRMTALAVTVLLGVGILAGCEPSAPDMTAHMFKRLGIKNVHCAMYDVPKAKRDQQVCTGQQGKVKTSWGAHYDKDGRTVIFRARGKADDVWIQTIGDTKWEYGLFPGGRLYVYAPVPA